MWHRRAMRLATMIVVAALAAACGSTSPGPQPPVVEVADAGPDAREVTLAVVAAQVRQLLDEDRSPEAVAVAGAWRDAHPADEDAKLLHVDTLIEVDQLDAAGLEDLRQATQRSPRDPRYLTSYGAALEQAARPEEAEAALRTAIEIDPKNARALRVLGVVRRYQFENQEAVTWLLASTAIDPSNAEGWFQLAIAQNELGDNDAAEASAARATALRPKKATHWYVYGELLRINRKPEEAIAAYRKALAATPPHPKAAAKIAIVLYDVGAYAEAEAFLVEQVALDRQNPYLYYNLGWVYSAEKKYAEGVSAFETYLELAPREDGDRGKAMAEIKAMKRRIERDREHAEPPAR
jgi:tetratricopeptide (TPR) repeat protein